jgi:hypothetical protein
MKKSLFALHAHKELVYSRAYLALLHSALIPLRETLNMLVTLATIGETNDESL